MTMCDSAPMIHPSPAAIPERRVFLYTIEGDLRFISHRDTIRLFTRALARASLPVRYSEGFNPHPKLSFPVPRPVGVASKAEAVVVEFEEPVEGSEAIRRLTQQMPAGLTMLKARRLQPRERLEPTSVRYRLDAAGLPHNGKEPADAVRAILDSKSIMVERANPKGRVARPLDVRPFITDLRLDGRDRIEFQLRFINGRTVRPAEIGGLFGFNVRTIHHRISRLHIGWLDEKFKAYDFYDRDSNAIQNEKT